MIKTIATLAASLAISICIGQKSYDQHSIVDSVRIATKWSTATDTDGVKKPAILIGIDNKNSHAITAGMEILFYYEGILRESGQIEPTCVNAGNRVYGKLNGIYFIPQEFTPEQLKQPDFELQIESIEIEETEPCK